MISLSVIIPVYNESTSIERIIGYLEEQNYDDMEVLFVVDSKTTDDSVNLISRFSNDLASCRTIMQNGDGKLGEARNIGVDEAKGEYIWFLDSDDRPYPDFISTMMELARKNDTDIVQCNFIRSFSLDVKEPKGNFKARVLSSNEALLERSRERIPVTAWSMVLRRDFVIKNKLYFRHGGYAEDVDFIYRALDKCNKFVYYNKPMYLYYQNPDSICFSKQNERGKWEIQTYTELEKHFSESNPTFNKIFRRSSAVMRIRSAGHMDRRHFIEYINSDLCKKMMRTNLSDPLSWDYLWVSISPSTYYLALNMYLELIYYRDNRFFDMGVKS